MFLLSVECEHKYKLKEKLKKTYKKKVEIFVKDGIKSNEKYKKYDYVITENDDNVINKFAGKKIIIIMNYGKKKSSDSRKNIYYCKNFEEIKDVIKKNRFKNGFLTNLIVSFVLVVTLCVGILGVINNINLAAHVDNSQEDELANQNYVFLGDSITEFYNLGDYYYDLPVVNSGKSGNRTYDILKNVDDRANKYNPTVVFLLVGTNDLVDENGALAGIDSEIVDNIRNIVCKIHERRKNAKVYVESIYPVNCDTINNDKVIDWMVGARRNERIKSINEEIKKNNEEYNYTYLDFYSLLSDSDGSLKLDYTTDGLHLSEEGYRVVTNEIMKIIDQKRDVKK